MDTVKVDATNVAFAVPVEGAGGTSAAGEPLPRAVSSGPVPQSVLFSPLCVCRAAISRDPFYEMLAARKKKVSSTKRH